eukprot:1090361-Prymnesium_polylepis.3
MLQPISREKEVVAVWQAYLTIAEVNKAEGHPLVACELRPVGHARLLALSPSRGNVTRCGAPRCEARAGGVPATPSHHKA